MHIRELIIALLVTASLMAGLATAQPLPDRPANDGLPTELPPDVVAALNATWTKDRKPKLVVVMGMQSGRQVSYGERSILIDRILSPLQSQLLRSMPGAIVAPNVAELKEKGVIDRLARNAGAELPKEAADALKSQFAADLILDVTFTASQVARGRYAVNLNVVDTRQARVIGSKALNDISAEPSLLVGQHYGQVIARSFAEQYSAGQAQMARTYSFVLVGLEDEEGFNDRNLRRMARGIEGIRGVNFADFEWQSEKGRGLGKLRVDCNDRLDFLIQDIEDRVLPQVQLAWRIQHTDATSASAFVFPDVAPDWHQLTNPRSKTFEEFNRARAARVRQAGQPRLGVVAGRDLTEPMKQFTADGPAAGATFALDRLRGQVEDQMAGLGFSIVESTELRRQLRKQLNNVQRFENADQFAAAMAELDAVDLVIHINESVDAQGKAELNVRFFEVSNARLIGFQHWPDASTGTFAKYRVDPEDPRAVARYLVGSMVARWDRFSQNQSWTLDVQVRNVQETQQVLGLADVFRETPGIKSVVDVQIAAPLASFELVGEAGISDCLLALMDGVTRWQPEAGLQMVGGTLIVDFKPKARSGPAKVVSIGDPGKPPVQPPNLPPPPVAIPVVPPPPVQVQVHPPVEPGEDKLAATMRQSMASVWKVVLFNEKEIVLSYGTGWTIAPDLLATNVHVVDSIASGDASIGPVYAIAISDANSKALLKLGRIHLNPRYKTNPNYDIAFVEIVAGNPGKPLDLATSGELDQLRPPERVGYIGFPGGVGVGGIGEFKQAMTGEMSAAVNTRLVPNATHNDRLIYHNLITQPGASGSPVFHSNGKVIAIHQAGAKVEAVNKARGLVVPVKSGYNFGLGSDSIATFLAEVQAKRKTGG